MNKKDMGPIPNPTNPGGFKIPQVNSVTIQHDGKDDARNRALYKSTPDGATQVPGSTEYKP